MTDFTRTNNKELVTELCKLEEGSDTSVISEEILIRMNSAFNDPHKVCFVCGNWILGGEIFNQALLHKDCAGKQLIRSNLKCEGCGKDFAFPEEGGYSHGYRICNKCFAINSLVEGLTCQICPVREQQIGKVKVSVHVLQQWQDVVEFCAPLREHNERPIETIKRMLRIGEGKLYCKHKRSNPLPNKTKGVKSMEKEVEFNFGDLVRDKFTDLEGAVMAKIEYFNGCKQVAIQGRLLHEGRTTRYEWIDVQSVELVEAAKSQATVDAAAETSTDRVGGPMQTPP